MYKWCTTVKQYTVKPVWKKYLSIYQYYILFETGFLPVRWRKKMKMLA